MAKVIFFLVMVIFGSFGIITMLNQNQSSSNQTLSLFPSPSVTQINLSPIKQQNEQQTPPVSPLPTVDIQEITETKTATIKTSKGDITVVLYGSDASKTVGNFIAKATSGFYNNLTFHRVEDWVVQGGDPLGNGTGGGNMPTELNNKPFVVGSLGIARGQDIKISNDAQFFITKKDASWLNGQYTNFGMVTNGMDVVEKLEIGDKILGIIIE